MIETEDDRNKFERLYIKYRNLMFYIANQILHNEVIAEDAVHYTFLKIIEIIDKIEDISCHKTKSLIVIMTRNNSINIYNRAKHHANIPFDEVEDAISDDRTDTSEMNFIMSAILGIPVIYSDILKLKYIQGYTNSEIAELLNITEANVRKRLERAREMLKNALEQEMY